MLSLDVGSCSSNIQRVDFCTGHLTENMNLTVSQVGPFARRKKCQSSVSDLVL